MWPCGDRPSASTCIPIFSELGARDQDISRAEQLPTPTLANTAKVSASHKNDRDSFEALSDNLDIAGEYTTMGSHAYGGPATADSEIVRRLDQLDPAQRYERACAGGHVHASFERSSGSTCSAYSLRNRIWSGPGA